MTEGMIKEKLDFLVKRYELQYNYRDFKGFYGGKNSLYAYSYYNKNGCFTITNYAVIGDIGYVKIDNIDFLANYLFYDQSNKIKYDINIFNYEPEIWKKHKKKYGFLKIPFLWGSDKQILRALAEVIEAQINKNGEFFGIKVIK